MPIKELHDFRHSHASILKNNGVNIVTVSKRLGHSNVEMTLKVYTYLIPNNNEEIERFFSKCSQTK